jgi:uncharacterized protein YqeY
MSLEKDVMLQMKEAMKAKNTVALESLRAIKTAIINAKTAAGSSGEFSASDEIKLLQKLVKQRKDSAQLYIEQGRDDLAQPELDQAAVIEQFLPKPLSEADLQAMVENAIAETGASSMKDMGKVMGIVSAKAAGAADGKTISGMVRKLLS